MFPTPLHKTSPVTQALYKVGLPVALLVWLLPLVGAILCMAVATAYGSGSRGDGGASYDSSGGYSGDNHSHHSHSSSDCSSDGGGGDGGSCGGGD